MTIPIDDTSLLIAGLIALVAFWLVFSMVRKVFGLVLLIVIALGGWFLWSNTEMVQGLIESVTRLVG